MSLVREEDALRALEAQLEELQRFASKIPRDRERYRYAPDKWSVREVIGHLTDAERVFGHRAFCISRGEQAPLPAFDENTYVAGSRYDAIPLAELARELLAVRETNLLVLRRLDPGAWTRLGTASGKPVSVRALAFVMVDRLIAAYKKNFEVWRDGELVHVRYGEVSRQCYCPVVKARPAKPDDLHCECTRATHQSIFETALGRPVKVDVVESLRRGGRTCHFVARV